MDPSLYLRCTFAVPSLFEFRYRNPTPSPHRSHTIPAPSVTTLQRYSDFPKLQNIKKVYYLYIYIYIYINKTIFLIYTTIKNLL